MTGFVAVASVRAVMTMSDYIKREDVERAVFGCIDSNGAYRLMNLPSADVVEVVRCKDCKYWHEYHCVEPIISPWEGRTNKSARSMNDFCSYGERKDGESE